MDSHREPWVCGWKISQLNISAPNLIIRLQVEPCSRDIISYMTLRHKHGHSGKLSHSLTYSKPLTFAERIPDFVNVGGVVRRAGEISLHFFGPLPQHYYQPRPSLLSHTKHSIMYTQACRRSSLVELILDSHTHSFISLPLTYTHAHTHCHKPNFSVYIQE